MYELDVVAVSSFAVGVFMSLWVRITGLGAGFLVVVVLDLLGQEQLDIAGTANFVVFFRYLVNLPEPFRQYLRLREEGRAHEADFKLGIVLPIALGMFAGIGGLQSFIWFKYSELASRAVMNTAFSTAMYAVLICILLRQLNKLWTLWIHIRREEGSTNQPIESQQAQLTVLGLGGVLLGANVLVTGVGVSVMSFSLLNNFGRLDARLAAVNTTLLSVFVTGVSAVNHMFYGSVNYNSSIPFVIGIFSSLAFFWIYKPPRLGESWERWTQLLVTLMLMVFFSWKAYSFFT